MRPLSGWTDPDLGAALGVPEPPSGTDPGPSETTSKNIPIIAGSVGGIVAIAGIAIVLLLVRRHKKNANKTDGAGGGAGGVTGVAPSEPPMTTYDPHHSMVYSPSTPGLSWDPQSGTYYQPAQPVAFSAPQLPGAGGYSSYKPPELSPIAEMPGPAPQELSSMQH